MHYTTLVAAFALAIPAVRLLYLAASRFDLDARVVQRERQTFLALLAAIAVLSYGSMAGAD